MARCFINVMLLMALVVRSGMAAAESSSPTWKADNGNGTFSNPLFYDELSDPDLIRVGDDFYLTGTTMHSMPVSTLLSSPVLVVDRGLGRVSLRRGDEVLNVENNGRADWALEASSPSQTFQWMETLTGEVILMSLRTHRYLRVDPGTGQLVADSPGPTPDGKDETRFIWQRVK
jgi:hypothetical protein